MTQAQREEFKLLKNQDIDFDTFIMFYRKLTLDSLLSPSGLTKPCVSRTVGPKEC